MRALLIAALALLAPVFAQANPAGLADAAMEVGLDQLLGAAARASLSLPNKAAAKAPAVQADLYANNFAALVRAAGGRRITIRDATGKMLLEAFVAGKEIQFEVVKKYLAGEAAKAVPTLGKALKVFESFGVMTAGNVLALLLTPTEFGYGQAFEFCRTGEDPEKAARFIARQMGTLTPEYFQRTLQRPGCAVAMLSYLEKAR